jgi:hypothetical protein
VQLQFFQVLHALSFREVIASPHYAYQLFDGLWCPVYVNEAKAIDVLQFNHDGAAFQELL